MKKFLYTILTFILLLSTGCRTQKQIHNIKLSTSDFHFIVAQTEDKIYFSKLGKGVLKLFTYNLKDASINQIGIVEDYMFSNNCTVEADKKLYFFLTTRKNDKNTNHFYCIDMKTNSLEKIYSEELYQTFNYMVLFNGKILSTKGDLHGEEAITYIEEYNPKTKERKIIKTVKANRNQKRGKAILHIASNNQKLYVYYEEFKDSTIERYVDIFNNNFSLLNTVSLKSQYRDTFFSPPLAIFKVYGNTFYFVNFSNEALLISFDNKKNPTYFDMENPLLSPDKSIDDKYPLILYKRMTDDLYQLTEDGNIVELKNLKFRNNYVIQYMTQYDSSVIIWLENINDPDDIYSISYDLKDIIKP